MKQFLLSIFFLSCIGLEAKVSIGISETMTHFIEDQPRLLKLLHVISKKSEREVINIFTEKKVKLALVRSDILQDFYQKGMMRYHIIGRVSQKALLYFANKGIMRSSLEKALSYRRISVGLLGDRAGEYLKQTLQKKEMLYRTHIVSQDAYRSLSALRRGEIDGFFLFASETYKDIFSNYLAPYPEGMKGVLKNIEGLHCENDRYCYASYYLIASDSIGKRVMENIYMQILPLLSKNRALSSKLGKYYIYTGKKRIPISKPIVKKPIVSHLDKKVESPIFHRTPWMDIAIKEAIRGKGSAENVLPMLDLSYKYIRFAKGNQGITTAPNDNKEGSWCAAYICWTLNKSGYKIHPKGRMASQSFRYFNNKLYRKIKKPIFGAITLYTSIKNPAHGHVGYLFGKTKSGRYILLGGNQSNRLKFADYPVAFGSYKLKGFYIPIDYKIKEKDRLGEKDIYPSAKGLNHKYGINAGKHSNTVR